MTTAFDAIVAGIPANKFYPPRFAGSQNLFRRRLVEDLLWRRGRDKQIFVIEAQAGQGKTTLIQQFLDRYELPFAWYQIGREDRDPVSLFVSLVVCLTKALPSFTVPALEKIIATGQLEEPDLGKNINLLLQGLDAHLAADFFLVFDDLHLLEDSEKSLKVINTLTSLAPPRIRFAMATRRSSELDFMQNLGVSRVLYLDNLSLALTLDEVGELFHSILHTELPGGTIQELHGITEGWVMGLVLAAHGLEGRQGKSNNNALNASHLADQNFLNYFRHEVYAQLPETIGRSLLLLSFLDEIPVKVARQITGQADIGKTLAEMKASNFFVRSLDDSGEVFALHHLFQEFLQDLAKHELTEEEISKVYRQAARFYQEQEQPLTALDYYVKAADYGAVEDILQRDVVAFLAFNRVKSLSLVLETIPSEMMTDRGWLLFGAGIVAMENAPGKALLLLERACRHFIESGDQRGELLTRSQIIWHHIISTGLYDEGAKHLLPAKALYTGLEESLSDFEKALAARNLGAGFVLFTYDIKNADYFHPIGRKYAVKHGLTNVLITIVALENYAAIFTGSISKSPSRFEEIAPLLSSQQTGVSSRMVMHTVRINIMELSGDFEGYERFKAESVAREGDQISRYLLGPYMMVWDMTLALTRGRFTEAKQMMAENGDYIGGLNPHYRSQILQKAAYSMAFLGEKEKALAWSGEGKRLRELAGGEYFKIYLRLYASGMYCQLGMYEEAAKELVVVKNSSLCAGGDFYLASTLLHSARLHLKTRQNEAAHKDLKEALTLIRKNGYRYLRALPPVVLEELLGEAVKQNIEKKCAQRFARDWLKKTILDDGTILPLLQIRLLGGFSVALEGKTLVRAEDLTPIQRELLTLLVASSGQKISREKVLLLLWPDSSPEKARSSFDTLLSRCRKILGGIVPQQKVKDYLSLQKGILALKNCRVDAYEFIEKAKKGLEHARKQEYWQADNAFYAAMHLWQGPFAPETFGSPQVVEDFRDTLLSLYSKTSIHWSEILQRNHQQAWAEKVLRQALRYDPLNAQLVRQLYHTVNKTGFIQARQVLRDYEVALKKQTYDRLDIAEMLKAIMKQSTISGLRETFQARC